MSFVKIPRVPRVVATAIRWLRFPVVAASSLDRSSRVAYGSKVVRSTIGRYSYVGPDCTVIRTNIGAFCSIADGCVIGGAAHPVDWVSTSPVFHAGDNILGVSFSGEPYDPSQETFIGNDVWVGSHCLIKGGVRVGNGAVIGMGSVLTHDVGSYEIWAGNPARLIRRRFDSATIERLETSNWWSLPVSDLERLGPLFCDVEGFMAASDHDLTDCCSGSSD